MVFLITALDTSGAVTLRRESVLAAMAPLAIGHGPAAAHYLLARRAARAR